MKRKRHPGMPLDGHTIVFAGIGAFALVTFSVLALGKDFRLLARLYSICLITWTFAFCFLFFGLYRGIRIIEEEYRFKWSFIWTDAPEVDLDAGDDPISFLVSLILSLLLTFILAYIISFLISSVVYAIPILYGIFYLLIVRSLRRIFLAQRWTRGRFLKSFFYALFFASLYTGWMFLVVYAAAAWRGAAPLFPWT